MKDFGEVHYCLGLQVIRNRENKTIHLSQQKYIENILERFNMKNCKPSFTPMEAYVKLSRDMCPQTLKRKTHHGQKSIPKYSGMFGICHDLYPAGYCLCGWNRKPIF